MDQQDLKLVQELLDFPSTGPDQDSEKSTASVHRYEPHIQQSPIINETEWGAILRKLEEASPMSATGVIDDPLRPSSASLHDSTADEQIQTPPHVGICSAVMSSFGDYMQFQQDVTQFANVDGDNQLEAQIEMGPNPSAVHIDPRLSRSNTCASTPDNSHLDSVLDELLSYNIDQSLGAQQSEHHRHQQYYQTQQSFSHCLNHVHESGSCTPATSASSDEPLEMEENLFNQLELNTTNSTDQSSSLSTIITELDHNWQQAQPGDEVSDKKRDSKGNLRVKKKPKRQRGSKVAFRMQSDTDIVDDGYKWRKYGQKAVKDSPYARSYYKCTDKRCGVKKLVERQRSEPDVVVTTYEGMHTHLAPSNRSDNESESINGPNHDLPGLCNPASHPDPISHYTTYLNSLNTVAQYIASCTYTNNTPNYSHQLPPPLSSSCLPTSPFISQYPTTTPALHDMISTAALDFKLRHHLLQLLMHHQDIDMARRSSRSL